MVSLRTAFPARHTNKGVIIISPRGHGGRGGCALVVGPGVWPIVVDVDWPGGGGVAVCVVSVSLLFAMFTYFAGCHHDW